MNIVLKEPEGLYLGLFCANSKAFSTPFIDLQYPHFLVVLSGFNGPYLQKSKTTPK